MLTKDQNRGIVTWCAQNTVLGMLHPEQWERVKHGLEFAVEYESGEEVKSKCDCFKANIVLLFNITPSKNHILTL